VRVLVIPEDEPKDRHVLRPIIAAMLAHVGRPRARVAICGERLGGVGEALKWQRIASIIDQFRGMTDLFLLIVDRDGVAGREQALRSIERRSQAPLGPHKALLAENAWQEVEVWVLAGHKLPPEWDWAAIRAHPGAKEAYFEPYARERGVADSIGEGRKLLADEAASNYARIGQLCDEVADLEARVRALLPS
jgi:hypothetical protein